MTTSSLSKAASKLAAKNPHRELIKRLAVEQAALDREMQDALERARIWEHEHRERSTYSANSIGPVLTALNKLAARENVVPKRDSHRGGHPIRQAGHYEWTTRFAGKKEMGGARGYWAGSYEQYEEELPSGWKLRLRYEHRKVYQDEKHILVKYAPIADEFIRLRVAIYDASGRQRAHMQLQNDERIMSVYDSADPGYGPWMQLPDGTRYGRDFVLVQNALAEVVSTLADRLSLRAR